MSCQGTDGERESKESELSVSLGDDEDDVEEMAIFICLFIHFQNYVNCPTISCDDSWEKIEFYWG